MIGIDVAPKTSRSFCVFAPTRFEFDLVSQLLEGVDTRVEHSVRRTQGTRGSNRVTLLQTQIGARHLSPISDYLRATSARFDVALICGLAAGLAPSLRIGDVVIYDRCVSASDGTGEYHADPRWLRAVSNLLGQAGIPFASSTGLTASRILLNSHEKISLGRRFNAQAADMETFQILEAMQMFRLPALALRSISDDATQAVADFNSAIDDRGDLRMKGLLGLFLREPFHMARLARSSRTALSSLRWALHCLLSNC